MQVVSNIVAFVSPDEVPGVRTQNPTDSLPCEDCQLRHCAAGGPAIKKESLYGINQLTA